MPRLSSGRWNTKEGWNFHILNKDVMRAIIAGDPIDRLSEVDIPTDLVKLDSSDTVLNYPFFAAMRDEYEKVKKRAKGQYKPSFLEKRFDSKVWDIFMSLYNNDSAYFQRIGGCMSVLCANRDVYNLVTDDYTDVLEDLKTWWDTEDCRDRTRGWIAWVFDQIIERYKEKGYTYFIINHMLMWIKLNGQNWQCHEQFDPENWFGKSVGVVTNALYGGQY